MPSRTNPITPRHIARLAAGAARLLVFVMLLLPSLAGAQVTRTANITGINLTMALDKTNIVVGEPIILTITMENVSPATMVELSANFQLSEGNGLEIMVQAPGELAVRYDGALQHGVYSAIPMDLVKGVSKSVDTMLLFDRNQASGLLFPKPGDYEISVKWDFSMRKDAQRLSVELPATQIHVTDPTGPNAQVLQLLNRPEYKLAIQLGAIPTTGMLNVMSDVANRFPATDLGALSLRAEGLTYTRSDNNAGREKGALLLQNYLANGVSPYKIDTVAWEIAAAYHRMKSYDLAREWVYYLVRSYSWSTRIRMEDTLIGYYYLDPAVYAGGAPWYLFETPWITPGTEPPTDLKPREAK